jgi:hypothetical protein
MFPTGQILLSSVETDFQFPVATNGPQSAALMAYGGSFTLNGATPVVVANANITADSMILIGLKTVGGTVGAIPAVQTKTAGTGFTVVGTALDTSDYIYLILG